MLLLCGNNEDAVAMTAIRRDIRKIKLVYRRTQDSLRGKRAHTLSDEQASSDSRTLYTICEILSAILLFKSVICMCSCAEH